MFTLPLPFARLLEITTFLSRIATDKQLELLALIVTRIKRVSFYNEIHAETTKTLLRIQLNESREDSRLFSQFRNIAFELKTSLLVEQKKENPD